MGLKDKLTSGASSLSYNGVTPPTNVGATKLSKLHAFGNDPGYSLNGGFSNEVISAYTAYNDGVNNALPQPSQLDLNGVAPSKYMDNLPG